MAVSLSKETKKRISLSKKSASKVILKKGIQTQKSEVEFVIDYSGSMNQLYKSGIVQRVAERILALGLNFDDDGKVGLYLFHHGVIEHPTPISMDNIQDFMDREVISKYQMGGTNYAPAINAVRKARGYQIGWNVPKKVGGFLGFGGKMVRPDPPQIQPVSKPTYVVFITDGENSDRAKTEQALLEASFEPIFWQFVGIGSSSFDFLEKLDDMEGRLIDNADFFQINDLDKVSDDELYERVLTEYPGWIKMAKNKGIVI